MSIKTWTTAFLISLLAVSSISFAASQYTRNGAPNPEISVLVYNYAQVAESSLERAKREAARVFRQAGVEIAWRDCPLALAGSPAGPACESLIGGGNLILRIVPRFELAPGYTKKETLGTSFGRFATISYQWVKEEAASGVATPSEILGPAIAHELGHLLLRVRGHSSMGIMRARWSREDFERAPMGTFVFVPQQAQMIRAEIRAQMASSAEGTPRPATELTAAHP